MAKSNLELVQELFESQLKNLNEKIDSNNKTLTDKITTDNKYFLELLTIIKEQTLKTNGKVIKVDQELRDLTAVYNDHLLTSATVGDIKEINGKIDKLNEENFIIKVWNRYPKQVFIVIAITVFLTIASLGYTMVTFHNAIRNIKHVTKTEQVK